MKKALSLLSIFLVLAVLLCACAQDPEPTTVLTTEPTTDPTTTPATEPITEPTAEPTVAPTTESTNPPTEPPTEEPTETSTEAPTGPARQEGQRLTEAELEAFELLFAPVTTPYAMQPVNYYGMALCVDFDTPENLNLLYYFNQGFRLEQAEPITEEERDFFARESGYDKNTFGDLYRLPAGQVNGILAYFFGLPAEQVTNWSDPGWVYNPDTDCFYICPPGALMHGNVDFYDGYYDETEGTLYLYYENRVDPGRDYVITLRSKQSTGESGYYILSNRPLE